MTKVAFLIHSKLTIKMVNNKMVIANKFCEYFTNVGKNFADAIPKSKETFFSYLGNNGVKDSIFLSPTDTNEICKIIKSMKAKTSCGLDNISSKLLKQICSEIAQPLMHVINKSMSEGVVPNQMKIAKVVPIYKAKERHCLVITGQYHCYQAFRNCWKKLFPNGSMLSYPYTKHFTPVSMDSDPNTPQLME